MDQLFELFGSRSAAYALLYLQAYESGHAAGISKTFDVSLSSIQRQLRKFESGGILVSRLMGNSRVFEFNPRSMTARNLQALLADELKYLPEDTFEQYFTQRRRPRRTGKAL